jgi:hypothetical protein
MAARVAALRFDFARNPGLFVEAMRRLEQQGDGSMRTYIELLLAASMPNGALPDVVASKLNDNASKNALKDCAREFREQSGDKSRTGAPGFQCQSSRIEVAPGQRISVLSVIITDGSKRWSLTLPQYQ